MRNLRVPSFLAALALALFIGACGGGGGGGGGSDGVVIGETVESEGDTELETVVVLYDVTGDDDPDLVTLNLTSDPYTIVDAVVAADGEAVDSPEALNGQPIDPNVSTALDAFLADSVEVASGESLVVTETTGREVTVVIYE
jgi:hypothetical protein